MAPVLLLWLKMTEDIMLPNCSKTLKETYLTSAGPRCGMSVGDLGILLGTGVLLVSRAGTVGT